MLVTSVNEDFYEFIKSIKFIDNIELKERITDINEPNIYSSSEKIYTDCEDMKYNITKEGYIHITKAENANYILYADKSDKINLSIYYLCDKSYGIKIAAESEILYNFINNKLTTNINNAIKLDVNNDNIYNINTFTCSECDNNEPMKYEYRKGNGDALFCKCPNCKTEYSFVPSNLYKMASKKVIFSKSSTSRNVDIKI